MPMELHRTRHTCHIVFTGPLAQTNFNRHQQQAHSSDPDTPKPKPKPLLPQEEEEAPGREDESAE